MAVLVGVDLRSPGHGWLLGRAARYASALGTTIDLVYFSGPGEPRPEDRQQLADLLEDLPEGCRGRASVEAAPPAEGLLALSRDYDLLVVGSRELPALVRLLRGPMATRVLRSAACPVLVPRGEHGLGASPRLLVGVDVAGEAPERLLSLAARWVAALGGTLDALYVDSAGLPQIADRSVREAAERQWRARSAPLLAKLEALLETVPAAQRGKGIIEAGNPEDVLSTKSADYDVTFVGNRDRVGLSRLLLGAVGDLVVRRACSDVISLPTNQPVEPGAAPTPG